MNMTHELRAEELRYALQRDIASFASLDGQRQFTNAGSFVIISETF